MNKLEYYNKFRVVPTEAKKPIQAGRLKGMTDINPMWRIKILTETFGMCGIGWKYVIKSQELREGCKSQISAFVTIDLFVKIGSEWSDAIPGTGGSSFVTDETKGLYQSDECFKMALTDALSIACKALGVGADVYFEKDRTKYDDSDLQNTDRKPAFKAGGYEYLIEEGTKGQIQEALDKRRMTPEQRKTLQSKLS